MSDRKTYEEALELCEKYGVVTHQQSHWNIIRNAKALLKAYQDGATKITNEKCPSYDIGSCTISSR